MNNTALYAVKKRKKPVQKIPKAPAPNGTKSNPSKRHRDRLNGELDTLTNLLPFSEEVRARLDKLSVLRLSVGYLKAKSFFNAALKAPSAVCVGPAQSSGQSQATSIDGVSFSEGDLLLQALNGFVLVVTAEGYVFYTSPSIQDFLGFHQSDVVHQSVFELIHTEDRALFRQQLHFAMDPNTSASESNDQSSVEVSSNMVSYDPALLPQENSSFLERNFCCRFRCLLDNSSGFLALNFFGRLKYLHGQSQGLEDGAPTPPQLALFAVVTPLVTPSILEIRSKTLLFQTKHKLDFTPMGIDARGKLVLGYTEIELCTRGSGYHFVHAADMMYCADQHLRMMKTGESGATIFRLITKGNTWIWVQSNARLVFKGGKPDFIVTRMKALTNEEGEEHLHLRRLQLPFNCASGDALLYDSALCVEPPDQCSMPKLRKMDVSVTPNSILGSLLGQDQSLYCPHNPPSLSSIDDEAFRDSHSTVRWGHSTIQDMMDTLQQILGDNSLVSSLEVEPEELRSWENTLMSMNATSNEMNADLNSVISSDILSFVEEQFQREGGFAFLDHLNEASLSSLDIPDQSLLLNCAAQRDCQRTFTPKAEPVKDTTLNGPLCHSFGTENKNTLQGFGQVCLPQCVNSTGKLRQFQPTQAAPPPPLHHPDMQRPLEHGFRISSTQWNCQSPNLPGSGVPELFTSSISNQNSKKRSFLSTASLQAHSSGPQRPYQHNAFLNEHQTTGLGQMSHRNSFPGPEEPVDSSNSFLLQQPSSCMFSNAQPQSLVNGVCHSSEQPGALSRPHCLYQEYQQNQETPGPKSLDTPLQPQPYLFSQPPKVRL
uniref:Aryl hydrocarbon receptor n=1 Tax=Neogobius melanostomus TaxID=47308 RepID=A0A8C6TX44_9GOBI